MAGTRPRALARHGVLPRPAGSSRSGERASPAAGVSRPRYIGGSSKASAGYRLHIRRCWRTRCGHALQDRGHERAGALRRSLAGNAGRSSSPRPGDIPLTDAPRSDFTTTRLPEPASISSCEADRCWAAGRSRSTASRASGSITAEPRRIARDRRRGIGAATSTGCSLAWPSGTFLGPRSAPPRRSACQDG